MPEEKTRMHRHNYETLIYIVEGRGYSLIEGKKLEWESGDSIYIPVWNWHQHVNSDQKNQAKYIACENTPLLQNLGGIALREERQEPNVN